MSLVVDTLARLRLGVPTTRQNLTLFPLLDSDAGGPQYVTLRTALSSGRLEVTEVSEAGSVPTLVARNLGEHPVLIIDGEELVGARQNRVANVSILVAAGSTVAIPVSCVERGRWRWQSPQCSDSKQAMHASGRRKNIRQVNQSLRSDRAYRGDQGGVWEEVERMAVHLRVESPTESLGDVFQQHEQALAAYAEGAAPAPGQCGAVFAVNGMVRGVEVFEDPGTFAAVLEKLLRSYALEAMDQPGPSGPPADRAAVEAFLAAVGAAPVQRFPGVGGGETLRLESREVVGAGLAVADRIVHLVAFAAAG